jgi:uncharacterized membrane protein YdjX (TVP38/TMEM64 family)
MAGDAPGEPRPDDPEGGDGEESLVRAPSLWKSVSFFLLVIGVVALVKLTPIGDLFAHRDLAFWRAEVAARGLGEPVPFVLAYGLLVAIGVPRVPLAAVAGALFGFVAGTLLAQWGALLGACLTFFAGRTLGGPGLGRWLTGRVPRLRKALVWIGANGFTANLLLRWGPVGHAFTTNLLMAISPMPARTFVLASFVGLLPWSVIGALFGSAAKDDLWLGRAGGAMVLALGLALFVGWWVRRRKAEHAGPRAG